MTRILNPVDVMNDPEAKREIYLLALAIMRKSRKGDEPFDYLLEMNSCLRRAKRAYIKYINRMNLAWEIVFMGYDEPQPIFDWAKEAIDIGNL